MKVKDLKEVLWSPIGDLQTAVVYDVDEHKVLISGCSIECAVRCYGECELVRVSADNYDMVLTVKGGSNE